mgnify:CR=1 FL=1
MLLTKLLRGTALEDQAAVSDREITGLTCDSRTVTPGALFAAFRGSRTDGNRFIREALDKGATAVLCQTPPAGQDGPWLVTDDPRAVFGQMAAHWFGDPGRRMTLIGVTGTNGKTTTTYLLKTILEQTLGAKVGLIGTNQNLVGHEVLPARRTTPDAYTLQALLAKMEGAGCSHVVMEVSSHALAQGRTAGLRFRTGIFTNLTRDHLDFHGNMTAYRQAKSLLFRQCDSGCFNLDDNSGRLLIRGADCRVVTFGVNQRRAEIRARGIRLEPDRVRFLVDTPQETLPVTVPIPGRFTVYNALGTLACCYDLEPLRPGDPHLRQPPDGGPGSDLRPGGGGLSQRLCRLPPGAGPAGGHCPGPLPGPGGGRDLIGRKRPRDLPGDRKKPPAPGRKRRNRFLFSKK